MLVMFSRNRKWQAPLMICTLVLGSVTLIAQDAQQTYPVHGTVLDSVTRQPIARALVDSHSQGATLTDNDGHFEFNLTAGSADLLVRRPGYEPMTGSLHSHRVQVGPSTPELTFTLTPEALITGQVTLSTADPADGIRVIAYRHHLVNGRMQWAMQSTATTNSEGIFRIARLQAGEYLLYTESARGRDGPAIPGAKTFGYPPVYYPGTADSASSAVLTLTAGQHAQADFALTRQRYYTVSFTVSDPRAAARTSFEIRDAAGHATGFPVRWDAMQGIVQATVPNGHYYLEANSGNVRAAFSVNFSVRLTGDSGQTYGRTDFTVANAPLIGLPLTLFPLRPIPVNIHKDFTASSSSNTAQLSDLSGAPIDLSSGLSLSLVSGEEFLGQGNVSGQPRPLPGTNDGTSFEFSGASPGRYWVATSAFQGYVSSITSGGVDLAREPLTIGPGGASASIEVTLRNDTGTITGQIKSPASTGSTLDSQAGAAPGEQPHIQIYAVPLFSYSGQLQQAYAQSGGQFTIPSLAPGSYRVLAFDAPQEIDFHTPEGLAKYTGKGQTVTVEAGGTAGAQIEVITNDDAEAAQP